MVLLYACFSRIGAPASMWCRYTLIICNWCFRYLATDEIFWNAIYLWNDTRMHFIPAGNFLSLSKIFFAIRSATFFRSRSAILCSYILHLSAWSYPTYPEQLLLFLACVHSKTYFNSISGISGILLSVCANCNIILSLRHLVVWNAIQRKGYQVQCCGNM